MTLWQRLRARLFPPAPPPAPAAPPEPPAPEAVFAAINAERARAGEAPLAAIDPGLTVADAAHAAWMAATNTLSHAGFEQRLAHTHPDRYGAENVAEGQPTVAGVMADWMASPGHRANILDPHCNAVGVGIARSAAGVTYWCTTFVEA